MTRRSTMHFAGAALLLAVACQSTLTGNEGNFQFSYDADDWITDFNKPIAVGAYLDVSVREVANFLPVDLTAASFDDPAVLDVVAFEGDTITVQGMGEGYALLEVEGETNADGLLSDSINMQAKVPEVLVLWHSCGGQTEGNYLTGQRVWVPFEMQMDNASHQPVIGYGYYPLTADTESAVLSTDESNQQWMAFDTAEAAGVTVLSSEIDDTTLTMNVVQPASIDGVQEPIAFVAEDIDVGDTNAFFVRPMVGDLPVCQADVDNEVVSDTPDICTVTDTEPVTTTDQEHGWFSVTGVAEGECIFTVRYPDGNGGEGAEAQFSYPIEP
jgi:hypothetical protein